jgi:hypothetical protein
MNLTARLSDQEKQLVATSTTNQQPQTQTKTKTHQPTQPQRRCCARKDFPTTTHKKKQTPAKPEQQNHYSTEPR